MPEYEDWSQDVLIDKYMVQLQDFVYGDFYQLGGANKVVEIFGSLKPFSWQLQTISYIGIEAHDRYTQIIGYTQQQQGGILVLCKIFCSIGYMLSGTLVVLLKRINYQYYIGGNLYIKSFVGRLSSNIGVQGHAEEKLEMVIEYVGYVLAISKYLRDLPYLINK